MTATRQSPRYLCGIIDKSKHYADTCCIPDNDATLSCTKGTPEALRDAFDQMCLINQALLQCAGISGGIQCSWPKTTVKAWLGRCAACGVADAVNTCAGCHVVQYCSNTCQKNDWKSGGHKENCSWLKHTNAAAKTPAQYKGIGAGAAGAADAADAADVASTAPGTAPTTTTAGVPFDSNLYLVLHSFITETMPAAVGKTYDLATAKTLSEDDLAVLVSGAFAGGDPEWELCKLSSAVEQRLHGKQTDLAKGRLISEQVVPRQGLDPNSFKNCHNLHSLVTRPLKELYSQSVPNPSALAALAGCGPLIEIGAGTGYWAMLLRERGVDVLAFDLDPPTESGGNTYHPHTWTHVLKGSYEVLAGNAHSDKALLLSWPTNNASDPWDAACLDAYAGTTVCYVGSWNIGPLAEAQEVHCICSSERFQTKLLNEFELVDTQALPRWPLVNDTLTIWKRK